KGHESTGPAAGAGSVKSVSPAESYGFIITSDDREFYFHENALKDIAIDKLNEGDAVTFGITEGEKGPSASWVKLAR
ncbi:MAG TPA: cold shock domain-containing protein, partial [Desulfurivibrionaceae bacterium]|nr:cold shock domain-containing protein [Desulfurivibrionaceae bacterium]